MPGKMHEFSVASQTVQSVLREAEKRKAKKVEAVYLTIGRLTFLNPEQVKFSYHALAERIQLLKHSKLHLNEQEGVVECSACGYKGSINYHEEPEYHFKIPTMSCPKCGIQVKIVEGKDCIIRRIKLTV